MLINPQATSGVQPIRLRLVSCAVAPLLLVTIAAAARAEPNAPEARTGFQMHVIPLTGISLPLGNATDAPGDSLSSRYGWQWVPLEVGLGAKVTESIYVGGHFNVGVGAEGSDARVHAQCERGDDIVDENSCTAATFRMGVEGRYSFTPGDEWGAWAGYGLGFTLASQSIQGTNYEETTTTSGIEFGRLSGGLDWRISRGFGMGPLLVASVGRYTRTTTTIQGNETFNGDVDDAAMHAWVTLAFRIVIFP